MPQTFLRRSELVRAVSLCRGGLPRRPASGFGPELLANPSLIDTSVWTLGSGWSIAAGQAAHAAGATSSLSQPVTLLAGKTYRVEFTVASHTGGIIRAQFTGGTTVFTTATSAPGVFSYSMVAGAGNNQFELLASSPAVVVVTQVSLRRAY